MGGSAGAVTACRFPTPWVIKVSVAGSPTGTEAGRSEACRLHCPTLLVEKPGGAPAGKGSTVSTRAPVARWILWPRLKMPPVPTSTSAGSMVS